MYEPSSRWTPILSALKHEIATVCSARTHRKRTGSVELIEFWEEYLMGLRMIQAKLLLACNHQTPHEYAEAQTPRLILSTPPRWVDFFRPRIKDTMRKRQLAFVKEGTAWKQVFNPEPRRKRGTLRAQKFWASYDKALDNARRQDKPDCPTQAQAQRELQYLPVAAKRFESRKPTDKIQTDWLAYLTPAELHALYPEAGSVATDDAPKLIPYTPPATLEPHPGVPPKKRGRPFGAKDSAKRTRATATLAQLQKSAGKRAAQDRMRTINAQRRLGINPYAGEQDA